MSANTHHHPVQFEQGPDNEIIVNVPLSKGGTFMADADDWERLSKYRWRVIETSPGRRYITTKINGATVYVHRLLMGAEKGQVVDHRNHNTFDNRKANLRLCTTAQNSWNQKPRRNRTGYRGVTWHQASSKWMVRIRDGRKRRYIGVYPTVEAAARAYDRAAMTYHGEFAFLNFPEAQHG